MVKSSAEAFAPATVANLGVGFDILGLALCEPGDTVEAVPVDEPGAHIIEIFGDGGLLPRESANNTACVAANSVLRLAGIQDHGVGLRLRKGLPLASGLGSSAASAVAAAVAVNALLSDPFTFRELLPAALDGEAAVSGYHADNVAPCLLGGITLVVGITANDIYSLPIPQHLQLALVTPEVAVPTAMARSVLPSTVGLKDMVRQTAAVARLMDSIYRSDLEGMAAAMESDRVVEPARAHLMPNLHEVRAAAKRAGAIGMVISGAGPTLCAICDDPQTASTVASAMGDVYKNAGMNCQYQHTQVAQQGARVLKQVS
jgi:homoserine kinase